MTKPRTAKAHPRRQQRMVRAWRRLKRSEILRAGDRPIYADGTLGGKISENEIGLMADESGYFGIARMKRSNVEVSDSHPERKRE